jgi:predicted porin
MKNADSMFALNNSRLQIEATNKKEDWMYSMVLILTGDLGSKQSVREAYLELTHKNLGTLIFGDTGGLESRVACGPSDFIPGTGGTDGNFSRMLNVTTYTFPFPSLVNDTGKATKAMYVTPSFGGIRFYVAYTPNTKHVGELKLDTAFAPDRAALSPFDLKSFAYAADYNLKSGLFSLNMSFVGINSQTHGELPNRYHLQRHNSKCYDLGIVIGIGPVSFGAEYFINGRSGTLKHSINAIEPTIEGEKLETLAYDPSLAGGYRALNLGIAIRDGASTFGLSYFRSSRRTGLTRAGSGKTSLAQANVLVFSFEQKLAPGLAAYVETGIYKMKNPDWAYVATVYSGCTKFPMFATPNNKATITLAGIKIQF